MIKVSFQNAGGELDSRTIEGDGDVAAWKVAQAVIAMIGETGHLYPGDRIFIMDEVSAKIAEAVR